MQISVTEEKELLSTRYARVPIVTRVEHDAAKEAERRQKYEELMRKAEQRRIEEAKRKQEADRVRLQAEAAAEAEREARRLKLMEKMQVRQQQQQAQIQPQHASTPSQPSQSATRPSRAPVSSPSRQRLDAPAAPSQANRASPPKPRISRAVPEDLSLWQPVVARRTILSSHVLVPTLSDAN